LTDQFFTEDIISKSDGKRFVCASNKARNSNYFFIFGFLFLSLLNINELEGFQEVFLFPFG
jgi:hypothetical protein